MRFFYMLSTYLLVTGLLSACTPWNCKKGTGASVESPILLEAFHSIVVDGSMDVHLTRSSTQAVMVEGQANLIELVDLIVKNGTLHVSTSKCYKSPHPLRVHVAVPSVETITIQGSGSVLGSGSFTVPNLTLEVMGSGSIAMDVDARRISASVRGSGAMNLKGTCAAFASTVHGSGDIHAGGLTCSTSTAQLNGSGSITVNATDNLEAELDGSGTIRYRNEPEVLKKDVNGSGSIGRAE